MSKFCIVKSVNDIVTGVLEKLDLSKSKLASRLKQTPQNFGKKLLRDNVVAVTFVEEMSDALEYNLFEELAREWDRKHYGLQKVLREPSRPYMNEQTFDDYIDKRIEKRLKERTKKQGLKTE